MEFVVTEIKGAMTLLENISCVFEVRNLRVYGFMWLKVERHLLFFPFIRQNCSNKKHKTIGRYSVI